MYPLISIKILTNSNQQTQSYKFTSHIAAFLSVVLITEMLEICIQTSYDQNVPLILKSYLHVVYGTTLSMYTADVIISLKCNLISLWYSWQIAHLAFNNILSFMCIILWSVLWVEKKVHRENPMTCCKSVTNLIT